MADKVQLYADIGVRFNLNYQLQVNLGKGGPKWTLFFIFEKLCQLF